MCELQLPLLAFHSVLFYDHNETFLTIVPMPLFFSLHMLHDDGDDVSLFNARRGDYSAGAVSFFLPFLSSMEAGGFYFTCLTVMYFDTILSGLV
jgi:hypothetical protein